MHQLNATPELLFAQLLAREPSRPFVTYYDEASGERSELSVKSLANWVAKTHHLLTGELGLGVGDRALLAVPAHWISMPVVLGCLTAGVALVDAGDADVAFVVPGTASATGGALDVYALAPSSAAVGFRGEPPEGTQDYIVAVRPQADAWSSVSMPGGADDPCLPGLTRAAAATLAADRAEALGLAPGGRLLTTRPWSGWADWVDDVLAPLTVGGSVVIVANCPDEATLARRAEQERVTASRI